MRVKNRAVGIPEVQIKNGGDSQRETIKRLLLELPAMGDSRIAKIVGCDMRGVSRIRREMLDSGEIHRHEPPGDAHINA